jgi:hypothetical protein
MKKLLLTTLSLLIPSLANGQSLSPISNVNNLATRIAGIGNIITYLLVGLAVIYIVWHVVQYFIKAEGGDRKEIGMNILWGIVGLFIIVSLWGLVNILVNTFYTDPNIPKNRFPNADFINGRNNTVTNTSSTSKDPSGFTNGIDPNSSFYLDGGQ